MISFGRQASIKLCCEYSSNLPRVGVFVERNCWPKCEIEVGEVFAEWREGWLIKGFATLVNAVCNVVFCNPETTANDSSKHADLIEAESFRTITAQCLL
jgi:hypothetical protein